MASIHVLRLYLDHVAPEEFGGAEAAEIIFQLIDQPGQLSHYFGNMEPASLIESISALEAYEEDFAGLDVASIIVEMLQQLPRLGSRRPGLLGFPPHITVGRVVLRMLNSVTDEQARLAIVDSILARLATLNSKSHLLIIAGHQENAGHKLISREAWTLRLDKLKTEIRESPPANLAREFELLWLIWEAGGRADPPAWTVPNDYLEISGFCGELLKSAATEGQSVTAEGDVSYTSLLYWDVLEAVLGCQPDTLARFRNAAAVDLGKDSPVLAVFDRYMAGWRPSQFAV